MLALAVASLTLAPAAAATRSDDPPPPAGGFVWPPPDTTTFAPAGDLTVSWSAGDVVTDGWQLVRFRAPLDPNGGCDTVAYVAEAPVETADISVVVSGQVPDECYRFAVWPSDGDLSADPTYASGAVRALTAWTGTYDLYRRGVFSSQAKITWCVGASIQMMLNIIDHTKDHAADSQRRYLGYAQRNDLYLTPAARGTDAMGWSESLAHYGGGDGYHQVSNLHYKSSIRAAVRALRQTGKPVGLIVAHSSHAWVLTGFAASADPALDHAAQITALYVMGPLWPRHTNKDGYDPAPDTRLTFDQLRRYYTRYYDSRGPNNPWEGTFVSILP